MEKCLEICDQLSERISQTRFTPASNASPSSSGMGTLPERLTSAGLQECKAKFEQHMKRLIDRLVTKSASTPASQEDLTDLERLRDEWETTLQCIDICSKADTNFNESVTTVDNYATGDAVQFVVSTDRQVIHGRNRGLGWRARQVGGHLDDTSLQQLSKIFTTNLYHIENDNLSSPNPKTTTASNLAPSEFSDFDKRYGRGSQLGSWKGWSESETGLFQGVRKLSAFEIVFV